METGKKYLGDGIEIIKVEEERMLAYIKKNYTDKYREYFLRRDPGDILDKMKTIKGSYLYLREEKVIGGAIMMKNYLTDLFTVEPYDNYGELLDKSIDWIKHISGDEGKICVRDVPACFLDKLKDRGMIDELFGYWMKRKTGEIRSDIPVGYEDIELTEENIEETAKMIHSAYMKNPATSCGEVQDYVKHVNNYIKNKEEKPILKALSSLIRHKESGAIAGCCFHMEFEYLPLIMSVCVSPEHWGRGIGEYMLKKSVSAAKEEYSETRLFVDEGNRAKNLYERVGFEAGKRLISEGYVRYKK